MMMNITCQPHHTRVGRREVAKLPKRHRLIERHPRPEHVDVVRLAILIGEPYALALGNCLHPRDELQSTLIDQNEIHRAGLTGRVSHRFRRQRMGFPARSDPVSNKPRPGLPTANKLLASERRPRPLRHRVGSIPEPQRDKPHTATAARPAPDLDMTHRGYHPVGKHPRGDTATLSVAESN